ncbi:MAG: lipid-A-disaccharide synthase N-terminal domain-containing protein [Planctomycetes bacterium]|nr:lipid-A-disaccharide synthase N-terminal domain-containing protein [Planctomycetota bacterium]
METVLLVVGFVGQALFAGRVIYQWIASERAGRPVVPKGYWVLSLVGAGFVLVYSIGRHNLVFVMSVLPGAVIAYMNMRIREKSSRRELVPWAVALLALVGWTVWAQDRLRVGPPAWAAIGLVGSIMWSLRHVFQWWISERRGTPTLPRSFWILSLVGGLFLLAYACSRLDPVMIAGYLFNCLPYVRILVLMRSSSATAAARSS